MSDAFKTKYRIMPAYNDDKQVGFVVFEKRFLSMWMPARLIEATRSSENQLILKDRDAYFKTEDEAKEYIERIKSIL